MGLFSDILEANRDRSFDGYIDPCMIMRSLESNTKLFSDFRTELNKHRETTLDTMQKEKIRQDFLLKSSELEKLKSGYLIAEKAILEISNHGKIQSTYMKDMLETLQFQLRNAYSAICQLRSEIDREFKFTTISSFQPDCEESIRLDILKKIINTTLHHMENGTFVDTSTFRKVVSDCAELIKYIENEDYGISDKQVFSYYLTETVGLKVSRNKCCNCGKLLLKNIGYCLNCYERNM